MRPINFKTQFLALNGLRLDPTALQWQPTLTAHDPNPPITLENAEAGGEFASGAFSISGSAEVSFGGAALASAAADAQGTATVEWVGAALAGGALSSEGAGELQMVGAATAGGAFASAGEGELELDGASLAAAALSSDGLGGAEWVGASEAGGADAFDMAGEATVDWEGTSETVEPEPEEVRPPEGFGGAKGRTRKKRRIEEDRELAAALRSLAVQIMSPYRLDTDECLEKLIEDLAPEIIAHYKKRVH